LRSQVPPLTSRGLIALHEFVVRSALDFQDFMHILSNILHYTGISAVPNWRAVFARSDQAYAAAIMHSYYTDVEIFLGWCRQAREVPFTASVSTVCALLESQPA
jgi:hypothetical protein